ncbi:MAG: hypothetical protein WCM93_16630, partial [Bacteroidota bacterium]
CTGYSVQENNFEGHYINFYGDSYIEAGIVVNNSGTEPNLIYNDSIKNLQYGILAQNQNRSNDGLKGLVLKCNNFDNTRYDQAITMDQFNQNWGIAKYQYQGDTISREGMAGNTFSRQHIAGVHDINNTGGWIYYYHHHLTLNNFPRVRPDWSSKVIFRPQNQLIYSKLICCPSKLSGVGISNPENLKQDIEAERNIIDLKETALNELVDGGNTDALNDEIIYSFPSEALALRQELLDKSPYLSDTTMQSVVAVETVLPNEMVRDILVANPQSANSEKVLNELDNRDSPMPDAMMAEILLGEEIISAKEELESDVASHKAIRSQSLNELIIYYKSDTINPASPDSLAVLLQNEQNTNSRYQLAAEYMNKADTSAVNSTLGSIPASFALDQEQQSLHENYIAYFAIQKKMEKEGKTILSLDSAGIAEIHNLFNTSNEPVRSYARNMLVSRGEITYDEPYIFPDETKSGEIRKVYTKSPATSTSYLIVFPNPAKHYLIVDYKLAEKSDSDREAILEISSVQGYQLDKKELSKYQDQILITTVDYKPGIYSCTLKINHKIIEVKMFTVIH